MVAREALRPSRHHLVSRSRVIDIGRELHRGTAHGIHHPLDACRIRRDEVRDVGIEEPCHRMDQLCVTAHRGHLIQRMRAPIARLHVEARGDGDHGDDLGCLIYAESQIALRIRLLSSIVRLREVCLHEDEVRLAILLGNERLLRIGGIQVQVGVGGLEVGECADHACGHERYHGDGDHDGEGAPPRALALRIHQRRMRCRSSASAPLP